MNCSCCCNCSCPFSHRFGSSSYGCVFVGIAQIRTHSCSLHVPADRRPSRTLTPTACRLYRRDARAQTHIHSILTYQAPMRPDQHRQFAARVLVFGLSVNLSAVSSSVVSVLSVYAAVVFIISDSLVRCVPRAVCLFFFHILFIWIIIKLILSLNYYYSPTPNRSAFLSTLACSAIVVSYAGRRTTDRCLLRA